MVGLKIRKKGVKKAPFMKNQIVKLVKDLGFLESGTLCRVIRCSASEAEVTPLVGHRAGQAEIPIATQFLSLRD
jgi:hypothetical protein|tara:strand:- start:5030 stop:5251 length:222 start_codon:yes stop_codon:yes gene_type:complete